MTQFDKIIKDLTNIQNSVMGHNELLHKNYRFLGGRDFELNGLCYPICECLYYKYPDDLQPHMLKYGNGITHWYLVFKETNQIIETVEPGGLNLNMFTYKGGKRRNFRTQTPSKRAMKIYEMSERYTLFNQ